MRKILATLLMLVPAVADAGVVSVRWTHENPSNVTGYRIYYGTSSTVYPNMINVSTIQPDAQGVFTYKILVPDDVVYLVVTAYNNEGESPYSNEGTFFPVGKPGAPVVIKPMEN